MQFFGGAHNLELENNLLRRHVILQSAKKSNVQVLVRPNGRLCTLNPVISLDDVKLFDKAEREN